MEKKVGRLVSRHATKKFYMKLTSCIVLQTKSDRFVKEKKRLEPGQSGEKLFGKHIVLSLLNEQRKRSKRNKLIHANYYFGKG